MFACHSSEAEHSGSVYLFDRTTHTHPAVDPCQQNLKNMYLTISNLKYVDCHNKFWPTQLAELVYWVNMANKMPEGLDIYGYS